MIHSTRMLCAILILSAAALAPRGARAQNQTRVGGGGTPKAGGGGPIESLSPQERDMLALANDLARRATDRIERWIADKETTEEKLFSFLYYPIPKTDPSKFNTDWDHLADRDFLPIQEAIIARSATILYAIVCDKNGYVPTHNQHYSLPLTGNAASDLLNNRTKRIFQDRTGFAAARSEAPFLIQRYQRDTGEVLAEVSAPLYVNGKHWGAVRLGYRPVEGR